MASYDGVPTVRLEGDEARALALLPEGKLLLSKAQTVARNGDIPTFSMSRRVSEDSYIYVLVAGSQNIIQISVAPTVVDKVDPVEETYEPPRFPDFLSGVVVNGVMDAHEDLDVFGKKREFSMVRAWTPTPSCARFFDLQQGRQPSERLSVRPYASFDEWRAPYGSSADYSQYQTPRSSQWSGTMASVVQLCMGLGRLPKSALKDPKNPLAPKTKYMDEVEAYGVQIRFDYKFMRSHGIYRSEDRRLWLVEISAVRGVVAMLLPIFPNSNSTGFLTKAIGRGDEAMQLALLELGCLPTGEAFPTTPGRYNELVEAGEILELLPPKALEDFYGRLSGFSSICGWSFSKNGEQAHNVGYYYNDEYLQRSCWYQININIGKLSTSRKYGEPIADGSATLVLQQEGYLYSPPVKESFIPVKYFEPMLDPPGLLSHSAKPLIGHTKVPMCDSPVYVGIVDGELKVAKYFRAGPGSIVSSSYDERIGEQCMYSGTWSWRFESGLQALSMMPYTNDVDARGVMSGFAQSGTMTVRPSGYSRATAVEIITHPQYAIIRRFRVFETTLVQETAAGESITGCFVSPGYLRDGYYFFDGHKYESRSGGTSVTYNTSLVDPNQGVSFAAIATSGGESGEPIKGCGGTNCGGKHEEPKIMCVFSNPTACSEYADSGSWLQQCGGSFDFKGSGIRGPGSSENWNSPGDFTGRWHFIGSGEGPASGSTPEILHDYAMRPSPDPETGSVQQLYAVRSALGEPCAVYTKGFNMTQVIAGYTPDRGMGMATFIGVNAP